MGSGTPATADAYYGLNGLNSVSYDESQKAGMDSDSTNSSL